MADFREGPKRPHPFVSNPKKALLRLYVSEIVILTIHIVANQICDAGYFNNSGFLLNNIAYDKLAVNFTRK